MATTEASSHQNRFRSSRPSRPVRYAREHGNELVDLLSGTCVSLRQPEADLLDKLNLHSTGFELETEMNYDLGTSEIT